MSGALKSQLDEHFTTNVLKTASYFQSVNGIEKEGSCVRIGFDIEGFAEQVLSLIKDLPPSKVNVYIIMITFVFVSTTCILYIHVGGYIPKDKCNLSKTTSLLCDFKPHS